MACSLKVVGHQWLHSLSLKLHSGNYLRIELPQIQTLKIDSLSAQKVSRGYGYRTAGNSLNNENAQNPRIIFDMPATNGIECRHPSTPTPSCARESGTAY
jgi:hypothetical protein